MKHSEHRARSVRGKGLSRREFFRMGSVATVATVSPGLLFSRPQSAHPTEKRLSFFNLHTGERLKTVYWAQGSYLPSALKEINWILRDYRRNKVKPIDIQLLDLLYALDKRLETREPFHIICGYRSPATNEFLREHSAGVAKHSMHIQAKAVDVRIPGCRLIALQRAALELHHGGVGIYPASDFVHVDVGRVRQWRYPATTRQTWSS